VTGKKILTCCCTFNYFLAPELLKFNKMSEQKRSNEDCGSCGPDSSENKKAKKEPLPYTMKLETYLYFEGNCSEAIDFYADCLNGKKTFVTTYKDAPMPVAEEHKNKVMHASLVFGDGNDSNTMMFSDFVPGLCGPGAAAQHVVGTNVHLSLGMASYEKMLVIWNKFKAHEKTVITMPLEKQFWGSIYGQLIDPFGIRWMFSASDPASDAASGAEKKEGGK
jgi:PhnB protein